MDSLWGNCFSFYIDVGNICFPEFHSSSNGRGWSTWLKEFCWGRVGNGTVQLIITIYILAFTVLSMKLIS